MENNQDRRDHPRMAVAYEVSVNVGGRLTPAVTHDVSPFDMSIYSEDRLEPGASAEVQIIIPKETLNMRVKAVVRYCIPNPDRDSPQKYLAGLEFTEGPLKRLPGDDRPVPRTHVTPAHFVRINAPAAKCYRLLADFERYPEWTRGVAGAKIVSRYPDQRGKRVEFEHNFFLRKVHYVLDYSYDDPHYLLSWASAGGDKDILGITGSYTFLPDSDAQTTAKYKLDITLSLVPSKQLVNYVTAILMRQEMKNFKFFVEKQP